VILEGKVGDGQGLATSWLQDPIFATLLGTIHPGSINVFVSGTGHPSLTDCKHPFFRRTVDEWIHRDGVYRQGFPLARDCTVNGHRAFILRTENPGPSYRRGPPIPPPHTMFEIVGAALIPGITYGADVAIAFDADPLALRTLRVP
jgi:hypothetical protein